MLRFYLDPRSLTIFGFGIASGFPWVLIGSMLTLWLQESGLSRSSIGLAGAIFGAYSINFLWSPVIDRVRLPLLAKLGQRRSFIVLGNSVIALLCLTLASLDAEHSAQTVITVCLLIAITSASQDIAIDAYRIDSIPPEENDLQAAGAAMATAGWWTGYAGLGYIPLALSEQGFSWAQLYGLMAVIPLVLVVVCLLRPEPAAKQRAAGQAAAENHYLAAMGSVNTAQKGLTGLSLLAPFTLAFWGLTGFVGFEAPNGFGSIVMLIALGLLINIAWQLQRLERASQNASASSEVFKGNQLDKILSWLLVTLAEPIKDFFNRSSTKAAIAVLLFIFLFKIGEAFLGRMSLVFYKELGFSNEQIGEYSKMLSWFVTIAFSLIGGLFTVKNGVFKGLFIGGIAMAASNLMFSVMAVAGPIEWLFALTVLIDGFTTSWSSVAFVAFISLMCSRSFSATQYALFASLGTLGRTLLSSNSGIVVDALGGNWFVFFILTALMVIPALAVLWWARKDIEQAFAAP